MEELKTSKEWWELSDYSKNYILMDPDGWDRENFHFSYYVELINLEEFESRVAMSTLRPIHA